MCSPVGTSTPSPPILRAPLALYPSANLFFDVRKNEEPRDPNWTFQPLLTKCPEKIRAKLAADGRDERGTRRMERMYKLGRERQVLCVLCVYCGNWY